MADTQTKAGGKHKQKRSTKFKGYYDRQFNVTSINKLRRAKRAQRRKAKWDVIKAAAGKNWQKPKDAKRRARRLAKRQPK